MYHPLGVASVVGAAACSLPSRVPSGPARSVGRRRDWTAVDPPCHPDLAAAESVRQGHGIPPACVLDVDRHLEPGTREVVEVAGLAAEVLLVDLP